MAEQVIAEVSGLQTSNNTFSASPPGSLRVAEECVMPQKGVIEPRRGQNRADTLVSASSLPFALTEFDDELIVNEATGRTGANYALGVVGDTPYTGTFNPVDATGSNEDYARMKFAQANGHLFFATTTGPKALDDVAGEPRAAGLLRMPEPLIFMADATNLGADGVGLDYGDTRSYRTVLRAPLPDGTSLLSPPSGSMTITNRLLAGAGTMTRSGGNLVTVTFVANSAVSLGIDVGSSFTLTPADGVSVDANFAAGTYTVTFSSGNVLKYADVGANVSNTVEFDFDTGPRPVALYIFFTGDVTDETPVRVYRTDDTATDSPGDEFFLAAEIQPDATDVSNGSLVYIDLVPASVISDPLYTNPLTGEGPTQVNNAPPLYRDLANWANRVWYAQTTGLQTLDIQMLGVGGPDGIQNNDTLTIDGVAFTFKTSAGASPQVQIVSVGTPAYNIQQTALNLISCISQEFAAATIDVRGYYASAQDGAPGKITLQAVAIQDAFAVLASRAETWVPALSSSVDTDSVAEYRPNGVSYSKLGQPESVPLLNYTSVGSSSYPIVRILPLKQALLVFKQGDGIYAVSGDYPFNVQQISVANIIAADAACVLADAAWAYTDQGVLRISDSGGATVVSRSIETELNEQLDVFPDQIRQYAFMVPYETERRLLLFMPTSAETTPIPTLRAWCYNNATQAWTGPLYLGDNLSLSGIVSPSLNKLCLGIYDDAWSASRITIERKGGSREYLNYADAQFNVTCTAVDVAGDSRIITLSAVTDVDEGDMISDGSYGSRIASIDGLNLTLYEDVPFAAGTLVVLKRLEVALQFQPSGNPTARKTLTRLTWLAKPEWFETQTGTTTLLTDQIQAEDEIETSFTGFGLDPFGTTPFGDPTPMVIDVNPLAPKWTNAAQFFVGFTLAEAWPKLRLQGFSMMLETVGAPAGRSK